MRHTFMADRSVGMVISLRMKDEPLAGAVTDGHERKDHQGDSSQTNHSEYLHDTVCSINIKPTTSLGGCRGG
jgi:hypothetical protein